MYEQAESSVHLNAERSRSAQSAESYRGDTSRLNKVK